MSTPLIGVLAIQGDFEAHAKALADVGAEARVVRVPVDLEGLDGLVIPGGESTAMTLGIEREELAEPLREFVLSRRNAFGRQLASFESELDWEGGTLHAVFIRAPWVEDTGEGVEVLAAVDGHPVAVRQRNVLAVAFHPELTDERRLHAWLLEQARVVSR